MRNLFIGLSLVFFLLSGIVLFKALNIPVIPAEQQNDLYGFQPEQPAAAAENASGEPSQDEAVQPAVVQDLQTTNTSPENMGPSGNTESQTNYKTSVNSNKSRILGVIGAGAFNSGQIVINDNLMSTIKEVVPEILSSTGRVYVEGHTDDIPIKASSDKRYIDNMELSFLRAKAVASILVENGISRDRISVTGYGETRPIAPNDSDEGRIKNRRVEIRLVPDDKEL